MSKAIAFTLAICLLPGTILAQTNSTASAKPDFIGNLVNEYNRNKQDPASLGFLAQPTTYVKYLVQRAMITQTDQQRIDKHVDQPGGTSNSTSAVSTGSVPWLLGFALEHGALTQSVDNNIITFRGNIANAIKAFKVKDYIKSYDVGMDNAFVRNFSKLSFSFSYNAAKSSTTTDPQAGTFAGYSVHFDLYNHRDPRDKRYRGDWASLLRTPSGLATVANADKAFNDLLDQNYAKQVDDWTARATSKVQGLSAQSSDEEVSSAVQAIADDFVNTVGQFNDVKVAAKNVAQALQDYAKRKGMVVAKINHSPVLSVEYIDTMQSSSALPQSASNVSVASLANPVSRSATTFSVTSPLPNLSTINVILQTYLVKDSQFTLNASTTLFTSLPAGSNIGTVRDYRFAGQTDIPLPEIVNLGKPTLSLSGLFLSLLQEPLGQQVLVNGVPESRTGNIGLFQAKLSFPASNGVSIPISLTASNRTELIKENDVRGSIGVTFNLDHIFAKQ